LLEHWRRERQIRGTLRAISRQRVALILQPGNVWVVERAPSEGAEGVAEALRTCHLRGWVDVLSQAVPSACLRTDGSLPARPEGVAPVYRVTEAGWHQLRRTYTWVLLTFVVAAATLVLTVFTLLR